MWITGELQPTQGQFSRLVSVLKRPRALFFLPGPPSVSPAQARLRQAPGLGGRDLTSHERRAVREAARLQRLTAWILERAQDMKVQVPRTSLEDPSEAVGSRLRAWLGVPVEQQTRWPDAYVALRAWRMSFEDRGLLVFQLPLGRSGIRGFSLWDARAPLIAVNTAYNAAARVYTMFHELAHLTLGEGSACHGFAGPKSGGALVERWCEEVAAASLLPAQALETALDEMGLETVIEPSFVEVLSRRFKASLRAVALRLVRLRRARNDLYGAVEQAYPLGDRRRDGGRGRGLTAPRRRVAEYGSRLADVWLRGLDGGAVSLREVVTELDLTTAEFDALRDAVRRNA